MRVVNETDEVNLDLLRGMTGSTHQAACRIIGRVGLYYILSNTAPARLYTSSCAGIGDDDAHDSSADAKAEAFRLIANET